MPGTIDAPLSFTPLFRERVWGGQRLAEWGKKLPAGKTIGESWEIVDRADAQSVVRQGFFAGRTLHELWSEYRVEIFGDAAPDTPRFPLLAKLLDAREKLSVQVHPSRAAASSLGGEAKTEVWYFLEAAEGAEIFAGLRRGVSREAFAEALARGEVERCLHQLATKEGAAFFVPSGRLHAIGGGNLIVEIQENSDTTYRVFDWNRRDDHGQPRNLHVAQAMQAIEFADFEPRLLQPNDETVVRVPEFVVEKWDLREARPASGACAFALFVCLHGTIAAGEMEFAPGDFFLMPATAHALLLRPVSSDASVLRVTLPR